MQLNISRDVDKEAVSVPARRTRDHIGRIADLIVSELVASEVEVVFGIPGGSIAPLYDALISHPEITVVTTRHEAQAVFAAAGYAQTTGKVGVVLVTSGPGVLNTMNGLGSCHTDGLPVVVLAGEASRAGFGKGAIQEGSAYALNVVGMANHVTKMAIEVPHPTAAPAVVRKALQVARAGRPGTVFVSLPLNVLGAQMPTPVIACDDPTTPVLPPECLDRVAKALGSRSKKLLLVGAGARARRTASLVRELAERSGCLVATTPKGKGVFPEDHPLSLGVFGMGGHVSSRTFLAAGVDVVMAVGTSLNEVATDGWSDLLRARRTFIHVEIDPARIGRSYPTDIGIAAPAEWVLQEILARLPASSSVVEGGGVKMDLDPSVVARGPEGAITAPRALWELQQLLPDTTIYTADSGTNLFYAVHYLKITRPECFVAMLGLGSMGTSLGAAIGAQIGHPDRPVVCVIGDGGLLMAAGDMATAAAHRLPIIIALLNNGCLGMVELGNRAVFGRTSHFSIGPFEPEGMCAAFGIAHAKIEQPGDISTMRRAIARRERPVLLDIRFDPGVRIPTNKRFETISSNVENKKALN